MVTSPEDIALAALARHQEEMGMTFDNPDAPVIPDPAMLPADWDEEV